MLSKAKYAGRICLTCRFQLRLNGPRPAAPSSAFPSLARRQYTASAGDGDGSGAKSLDHLEQESARQSRRDVAVPDPEPEPEPEPTERPVEPDNPRAPRAPHAAKTRPPRWRGHNRVDIETPSIGMDILGKAGHTIVLRDRERRRTVVPTVLEEETHGKDLDIEKTLEEQRQDTTLEETRLNIEELRPGVLPRDMLAREFDDIANTLMEGFTSNQLEDYVCHFMGGLESKSAVLSEKWRRDLVRRLTEHMRAQMKYPVRPRHAWIRKQYSWTPPSDYPWGNTLKEKLALAIMRACWHLQVIEETPYVGEVEIGVDQRLLNLLLVENRTLRAIQNNAGIRVFPEREVLKIIATRSGCDAVLGQLDKFASRIEESTIPLSDLGPRRLSDEDLRQLSTLTNAYVEYTGPKGTAAKSRGKRSDEIRISWLQTDRRPDTVESLQHIVLRLLLCATTPADGRRTVKTVLDKAANIKPADLVLARRHGDNHELPWDQRHHVWARLMCPAQPKPAQGKSVVEDRLAEGSQPASAESIGPSGAPEPKSKEHDTHESAAPETDAAAPTPETQSSEASELGAAISASALHLPLIRHDTDPPPEGWSPLVTRTSATFGHLLHPYSSTAQYKALAKETPAKLSPVSPPIPALTSLAAGEDGGATSTTILVRFRPAARTSAAPPLELSLRVPEQQDGPLRWDQTEKELLAVRYAWTADVLLPLLPVDVSVQQSIVSQMSPEALESCAPLRAFFEGAKLDLASDLLTPASLSISLPAPFLRREGAGKEETGEAEGEREAEASEEVEYLFTGLELHTTSTAPFRSHRLSYTSVEAGQQGRSAQLSLHPPPPWSTPQGPDAGGGSEGAPKKEQARAYLDEVLRVAEGRYFSWVGSRPLDPSIDDS